MQVQAEWAPREGYRLSRVEEARRLAFNGSMVWRNPDFAVRGVPEPDVGADEVVIGVRACGICGSDVHVYERDHEGYMLYPGMIALPVVTGHEFAGEVVAVGPEVLEVLDLRRGDPVCAEEIAWCGSCIACRSGHPNSLFSRPLRLC
jgi:scyllo-inosose 3-dehydrogenase